MNEKDKKNGGMAEGRKGGRSEHSEDTSTHSTGSVRRSAQHKSRNAAKPLSGSRREGKAVPTFWPMSQVRTENPYTFNK